jgi:hypothetical protein
MQSHITQHLFRINLNKLKYPEKGFFLKESGKIVQVISSEPEKFRKEGLDV